MQVFIYIKNSEKKILYTNLYMANIAQFSFIAFDQKSNKEILLVKLLSKDV